MVLKDVIRDVEVLHTEGPLDIDIKALTFDSRQVTPDSLFFCIEGLESDGHDYADAAISKGARALVLSRDINLADNITKIFVKKPRRALGPIASNFYGKPSQGLTLVGVTGTNGKTTTTYLIKSILDGSGIKAGLVGTIKNIIGDRDIPAVRTTPDPILLNRMIRDMTREDIKAVVMEVSSHALELDRVEGLSFETGVFTNLSQDHLDFHGSLDKYLESKKKLFSQSERAVINIDDEYGRQILKDLNCKVYTYGLEKDANIYAKDIDLNAQGVGFSLCFPDKSSSYIRMGIPGLFSVYNGLAAATASYSLGQSIEAIKKGLEKVRTVAGRFELLDTKTDYSVIIDYAHTPDGLQNILRTARALSKGRLILLFGCGGDRDRSKRPIMGKIAGVYSDFCIVTSDNPRSEDPMAIIEEILPGLRASKCPYEIIEDRKQAIAYGLRICQKDDLLILAGKGHETYQILGDRTIHFDEREIVADLLGREKV